MLEALGPEYLVQHVAEAWRVSMRDRAWRTYVAENLRIVGENTAKIGGGSYLEAHWEEPDGTAPGREELRSEEEVIADITAKLKGVSPG